jgi:sarcosine oxidase subunit beta
MNPFSDAIGGSSGFVRTGYLVVVEPVDRHGLEPRCGIGVAMQQELGINTSLVTAAEVKDLAPMLVVSEEEGLAWEPESGYADPYMVTTSYAARARELGAEIRLRTPAVGIKLVRGRVQGVITRQGTVDTPLVVVATGPPMWHRGGGGASSPRLHRGDIRWPPIPSGPVDQLPQHPTVGDIAQSFSFRPEGSTFTMIGFGEEEVDLENYNQGVRRRRMAEMAEIAQRMAPDPDRGHVRLLLPGWLVRPV